MALESGDSGRPCCHRAVSSVDLGLCDTVLFSCGKQIMAESAESIVPVGTLATLTDKTTSAVPRTKALYDASLANALNAAALADQLRGQNILVLDLTKVTSIVDFFVIVTATSQRQAHAIADEVNRKLKHEDGNRRISIEGYRTEGNWILTDYGDVVLHVFTPEGRALYNLEQLWSDAPRVEWQPSAPSASAESNAAESTAAAE